MYCIKCGNRLEENQKFCTHCGTKVEVNTISTPIPNNPVVASAPVVPKKKFKLDINTILIIAIVFVCVLTAIGVASRLSGNKNNRTIMIYMVGANLESGPHGLATVDLNYLDYNKIANNNTRVVLMAGGAKGWHNDYISSTETSIYELTENGFIKVQTRELTNMGSADNLAYFLNFVYDNYKSNKYNLIFWNHGGAVDGSEYDELSHDDNLHIPELRSAFENSPFKGNNKLQTISFRTCLNATIEIAYLMKDYGEFLVASEEVTIGSPLASALEFINDVSAKDDGKEFGLKQIGGYSKSVTTYCNYAFGGSTDQNLCVNFTYSITDLSKVDDINTNLDLFAKDITNKASTNYNDIIKVRASLKQYAEEEKAYDMVDLYDLVSKLKNYSSNADKLLKSIENAVIYNLTNNEYSHGLSIYFSYNATHFLGDYQSIASSKNYSNLLHRLYEIKKNGKDSSFSNFSNNKASVETKKEEANFEVLLTDEQVKSYAASSCYVFADNKDGYHSLVYFSRSPYLDGNKLKANVKGKMLRISDIDYEDESYWLALIENESNDEYVEAVTTFLVTSGVFNSEVLNATIRIDKDHPNGYIKSIINTSSDKSSDAMILSNIAVQISDYALIQVWNRPYKLLKEDGSFNPNFLKERSSIYYGWETATDAFKLIQEDFSKEYDYYAVFAVTDTLGNTYYSDVVKMN